MTIHATRPCTFTKRALAGIDQHQATRDDVDDLLDGGRAHRRGTTALVTSPGDDLRVLVDLTQGRVLDVWRGARHDGQWRTALTGHHGRPRRHATYPTARTTSDRDDSRSPS